MAPTRLGTAETQKKTKYSKRSDEVTPPSSVIPGVQKIKSSLRQTRRLLAKDDLAADVRIETERRLKSLESDLTRAERTRKARTMAVKYHKMKFFERQKVCRKIKQAKKKLDGVEMSPDNIATLRETLFSHRVDLNYILHYPQTKKYISLFPPEESKVVSETGSSDTEKQREELRRWVKTAMERGDMDAEPEVTMDKRRPSMQWEEKSEPQPHAGKKGKQKEVSISMRKGVPDDAFFEAFDGKEQVLDDGG